MVMSLRAPDSSADFDQKGARQIDGRGGEERRRWGEVVRVGVGGREKKSVIYEQLVYQPII